MKKLFIAAPIFILFVIFLTTTGCPGPDPGPGPGFEPAPGSVYFPPDGWEIGWPDPPPSPTCTEPRPPAQGCTQVCKPCRRFVCVDGQWKGIDIVWPDGLCGPRNPNAAKATICVRDENGYCPPKCTWCF